MAVDVEVDTNRTCCSENGCAALRNKIPSEREQMRTCQAELVLVDSILVQLGSMDVEEVLPSAVPDGRTSSSIASQPNVTSRSTSLERGITDLGQLAPSPLKSDMYSHDILVQHEGALFSLKGGRHRR